jgi:chaperonin cofactor prefoldin
LLEFLGRFSKKRPSNRTKNYIIGGIVMNKFTGIMAGLCFVFMFALGLETYSNNIAEEEMEQMIQQYEITIEEITEQNNIYSNEIQSLQEELETKQRDNEILNDKIDSLNNQIDTVEEAKEDLQKKLQEKNAATKSSNNESYGIYEDEETGVLIYDPLHEYRNEENNNIESITGSGEYYIAEHNTYYHNDPNCKFINGLEKQKVTKGEAQSLNKKVCNCIKY